MYFKQIRIMINVGYVYKKNEKYRVYTHEKALIHHNSLIANGYIHVSTIDAFVWIENKLNKRI